MAIVIDCFTRTFFLKLQLHGAIYRPDSFVMMLRCANLNAIRYESTSLNRIVADKSHRVIVALERVNFHNVFQWQRIHN